MSQPPPAPRPAADPASTDPAPTAPAPAADLTVNKVLAGAGAAATSAVLGSYFGATGTVAGAALGSVASTVATTLYQRSLDRTRDHLVARVRLPGRQNEPSREPSEAPTVQLEAPRAGSPDDATTVLRVEPALRRPRPIWLWAGATVLVFVIGLLVVTGLEWAKGSSLTTGQPGTSVGRVLTPVDRQDRTESTSEATPSAEPTTEPEATEKATSSAETTSTDESSANAEPSARARESDRSGTATPLPTPETSAPAGPQND